VWQLNPHRPARHFHHERVNEPAPDSDLPAGQAPTRTGPQRVSLSTMRCCSAPTRLRSDASRATSWGGAASRRRRPVAAGGDQLEGTGPPRLPAEGLARAHGACHGAGGPAAAEPRLPPAGFRPAVDARHGAGRHVLSEAERCRLVFPRPRAGRGVLWIMMVDDQRPGHWARLGCRCKAGLEARPSATAHGGAAEAAFLVFLLGGRNGLEYLHLTVTSCRES
jgi:hypothetical protein